jgi:hypothetical protein
MTADQARKQRKTERLQDATDFNAVDASHNAVVLFYAERHEQMAELLRTAQGDLYSEEERAFYHETGRVPLTINKAVVAMRTIVGNIAMSLFEAKFEPVEKDDEALAETLGKLAEWEARKNEDAEQNAEALTLAFITGKAYRVCEPAKDRNNKNALRTRLASPLNIYFDPDSRDSVERRDAQFVDEVRWLTVDEILDLWPSIESHIGDLDLADRNLETDFETYNKATDLWHEGALDERNGKYRVITRYYQARGADGKRELWQAVWSPGLVGDGTFLFNGKYGAQPIDPDTGRVMFPVVELVSDTIQGESQGYMKAIRDPAKMASVLYTQLLEGAKHNGTGYLIDPTAFKNPKEAAKAKKYKAFANMAYEVTSDGLKRAMVPIEHTPTNPWNAQAMALTSDLIYETTSATPTLQGAVVSRESGTLNQQRIQQSGIQISEFTSHYKAFLRQMLKLRYAYWRELYTREMTFRILNPETGKMEARTINQMRPQKDLAGDYTGDYERLNDINSADYDIYIADSVQSPGYKEKQYAAIQAVLMNPAIAANPVMATTLGAMLLENSDITAEQKAKIQEAENQAKEAQKLAMQTQQAQAQLAKNKAVQTQAKQG